jgi:dienelactone hydrolase
MEVFRFRLLKNQNQAQSIVNFFSNDLLIMKSQIVNTLISFLIVFSFNGFSQKLINATELGVLPAVFITFSGITDADYSVRFFKITYHTNDVNGNPTIASGMVAVPISPMCDSVPMVLYAHGTVLLKSDVPSSSNQESDIGKAIASRGFIVAMPDYLGLGDSPGFHNYMHASSTAESCVDILRATQEFVADSLPFAYNNHLYLTGYSQGGHSAMATAKYIQENQLETEFQISGLVPMSGPYHLSKRQTDEILLDNTFLYPGITVYLIMSYQNIYGGIYTSYSDFLQSPYDTAIPPLFDGTHELFDVNMLLPTKSSQYLTSSFISDFIADSSAKSGSFWQAIVENDNYDWTPQFPVKLLYCDGDDLVKPENSFDTYVAMQSNGVSKIEIEDIGTNNHLDCVIPSVKGVISYLNIMRTDCMATGVFEIADPEIQIYPNPASNLLFLTISNVPSAILEVYSLDGRLVHASTISSNSQLDVSNWESGLYLIGVRVESKMFVQKISVVH